ncbi:putative AC transposase [Purpureocillium lavendulum]|uniref:AC transposase n=1 Tax=Purpureocillium lavendulum TaxID=1247861 RepID=A0AB34FBX6_9HYPO|nr:putative AC transposase [Purpureocillium lavendulum]
MINNWENVFSLIFKDGCWKPINLVNHPNCCLMGKDLVEKLAKRVTTGAYLCLLTDDMAGDHKWIEEVVLGCLRPYTKTGEYEILMLESHITLNIQDIKLPGQTDIAADPNKLFNIVKAEAGDQEPCLGHIQWGQQEDAVSYVCVSGRPSDDNYVSKIMNSEPFYWDKSRGIIEWCKPDPDDEVYKVTRFLGRYRRRFLVQWKDGSVSLVPQRDVLDKKMLENFLKTYRGLDAGVDLLKKRRVKNGNIQYQIRWPGEQQKGESEHETCWNP